jgi:hypothetical protein
MDQMLLAVASQLKYVQVKVLNLMVKLICNMILVHLGRHVCLGACYVFQKLWRGSFLYKLWNSDCVIDCVS